MKYRTPEDYAEEISRKVEEKINEEITTAIMLIAGTEREKIWETYRAGGGHGISTNVLVIAAEMIARRFVEENYDKVIALVDIPRLAKMVEFRALGRMENK